MCSAAGRLAKQRVFSLLGTSKCFTAASRERETRQRGESRGSVTQSRGSSTRKQDFLQSKCSSHDRR